MAITPLPTGAPSLVPDVVSRGSQATAESTANKATAKKADQAAVKPSPLASQDILATTQPTVKALPVIAFAPLGSLGAAADTKAALADFSALAQTFAGQKPNGPVAEYLSAQLPELEGASGNVWTAALVSETLASASHAGTSSDERRSAARLTLLAQTLSVDNAIAQRSANTLTPAQRDALMQVSPHVQRAFASVKKWLERAPGLGHAASAQRADLGASTAPGTAGQFVHPLAGYVAGAQTQESDAGAAFDPGPEIPGPHIVALEQSLQRAAPNFKGLDIDSLVQLVMSQCAQDTDNDLEDIVHQLQKTTKQKEATRAYTAAEQKAEADGKTLLQTEYTRRCNLPAGNPLKIYPSLTTFDQYSQMQKLVQVGEVSVDTDGVPSGTPRFELSPNVSYFPTPQTNTTDSAGNVISQNIVDQASRLNVSPQNLQALSAMFMGDMTLQARFGSFARWLLESSANGGLGLSLPSAASQDVKIAAYRQANDPTLANPRIADKYRITPALVSQLRDDWANGLSAQQRAAAGTFENWLSSASGVNLDASDASANTARANAVLGSGPVAVSPEVEALMTNDGLTRSDAEALVSYWDALPQAYKSATFPNGHGAQALLDAAPSAGGAGFGNADIEGSADTRHAAITAFFTAERARLAGAAPTANPEADDYDSIDSAIGQLDNVSYTMSTNSAAVDASIDGFRDSHLVARNPDGSIQDPVEVIPQAAELDNDIGTLMSATIRLMHANHWDTDRQASMLAAVQGAKTDINNLINALPEPTKTYAREYLELRLGKLQRDSQYLGGLGGGGQAPGSYMEGSFFQLHGDNGNHFTNSGGGDDYMDADKWGRLATEMTNTLFGDHVLCPTNLHVPHTSSSGAPSSDTLNAIIDGEVGAANDPATTTTPGALLAGRLIDPLFVFTPAITVPDDPLAALGDPPTAMQNQMSTLDTAVDHSIHQPGQTSEGSAEMTVGDIDADVTANQGKMDTFGDMSQQMQTRLQLYMDRRSQFYQTLSNIMKKSSDTEDGIVANLK